MKGKQRVYFIGIGGIGMSAIARYMNSIGNEVFGYDKTETELTKKLVGEGMKIHYSDDVNLIPENIDLVVYTPAVPNDHSELNYFKDNGYDVIKRAEMLGRLSNVRKTIAIAGTHGKTSTSATTAHLLKYGGLDISAFVGGIMSNYSSNYVEGAGEWIVVEADEYDRSFLHLTPDILSIMSMDADHLDIFGNHDVLKQGFEAFIKQIKDEGLVILREGMLEKLSDELLLNLSNRDVRITEFGIEKKKEIDVINVEVKDGSFYFDYHNEENEYCHLKTNLPGRHNIENASVAIKIASELGLSEDEIRQGLESFKGIKRRFEKISDRNGVIYIDDYAHHPTELNSAISAAREMFPDKKLTGVFQPHLFSRTRDFVNGFAETLDGLDEILLMDIYPAREKPIEGVTSKMIFEKLKTSNKKLVTKESLMDILKNKELEVLMTLGAGDIDVFVPQIKKWLET